MLCYVMLFATIQKKMDGNNDLFTGKIHLGSRVCDGARIPRRPCNGDDGVQVRRRLQPVGQWLTDGKLGSGALPLSSFPPRWVNSLFNVTLLTLRRS